MKRRMATASFYLGYRARPVITQIVVLLVISFLICALVTVGLILLHGPFYLPSEYPLGRLT
jgi:hypothetical protein